MSRLTRKHSIAVRWNHWINFPVLAVMIWSGLMIYWADDVYRIGAGPYTLVWMKLPDWLYDRLHMSYGLAIGMAWHFAFFGIFALNGIAYVTYLLISGERRAVLPNRRSLRDAVEVVKRELHLSNATPDPEKYNGAQRIAYTAVILMGFGSLITGLVLYKPVQFAWLAALVGGAVGARFVHFWLTMGYVAFFLVHIAQVIRAGWNHFRAMVTGYELAGSPGAGSETDGSV